MTEEQKKEPGNSELLSGILKAGAELQKAHDLHIEQLAKNFTGMKILESQLLNENEIAIMCGSNIYRVLLEKIES